MIRSIINTTMPLKKMDQLLIRTLSTQAKPTDSVGKTENNKQQRPWQPTKRVSRITMEKMRSLAALYPNHYNSVTLATEFRISPEAVKRILKSKFQPKPSVADRQERNRYAAMGERKQQIQSKSITFSSPTTSSRKPFGTPHSTWKKD